MIQIIVDHFVFIRNSLNIIPATYWWMLAGCGVLIVAIIGYMVWDAIDYKRKIKAYWREWK